MSTQQKWYAWAKRNPVQGERYARLMARLVRSPRADREFRGRDKDGWRVSY